MFMFSKKFLEIVLSFFILLAVFSGSILGIPPKDFPSGTYVDFSNGDSVSSLTTELRENNIIKSELLFKIIVRLYKKDTQLKSGSYFFDKPESVLHVAKRFMDGTFGVERVKFVVQEGLSNKDIASLCQEEIVGCKKDEFLALASLKEGMLFPDTYFFFKTDSAEIVVDTMYKNFEDKTKDIFSGLLSSEINDILTMASILEWETNSGEERFVVSGILYNRLRIGMPLQVDAPFLVYLEKGSGDLTLSDLKIDEPWNTYIYKGLPPGPIGNPGLESIQASLNPKDSDYLYYLHDGNGEIHYGRNFEEHKNNKNKYLN